jgi:tetratricopeptide (TPR) repeat protein
MTVCCLLIVCSLLWGQACQAQTPWYVHYEKALNAQEENDWTGSIPLLQEALREKNVEAAKSRTYGLRFVNYFPYFHLGVAYYHLHDKYRALASFDSSLAQGHIQGTPGEFATLQALKSELLGLSPAYVASTPEEPTPMSATAGGLPWYVSYETGVAYLESGDWVNAIENLKLALTANAIPRLYARTYGMWFVTYIPYYYLGTAYYNQGLWDVAVNFLETSERFGEVKNLESESAQLKTMLIEARKRSAEGNARTPSDQGKDLVNAQIAEAVRLYNLQEYGQAESKFRAVLRLDPYNTVAKSYLSRMPDRAGVPGADDAARKDFSSGVFQLLRGRHEEAIRLLTGAAPILDHDASLHGYLGVAYFLRYRAGGKKNTGALKSAQQEFKNALSLDPSYELDSAVFSRDVLNAFQNARKSR